MPTYRGSTYFVDSDRQPSSNDSHTNSDHADYYRPDCDRSTDHHPTRDLNSCDDCASDQHRCGSSAFRQRWRPAGKVRIS